MIWTILGIYLVLGAAWGWYLYPDWRENPFVEEAGWSHDDLVSGAVQNALLWPYSLVMYFVLKRRLTKKYDELIEQYLDARSEDEE